MMGFLTKENKGFFEFFYNKEDIIIETTLDNAMNNVKVIKSIENQFFYDYMKAIMIKKDSMKLLTDAKENLKDEKKIAEIDEKISKYNDEVMAWQIALTNENKEKLERVEKNVASRSVDFLATLYQSKRDKARGKDQKAYDEFDAKYNFYDTLHDKYQ